MILITPKITNLGYSNLWTDMSAILGYASNFQKLITKLFANGEQGFFYDPSDMGTMFQDAAGTIPVTAVGQPVGLIRDKSGRNNHAFQTTSASRPLLRQNAITGANYLEFDGADDFLQTNNIDFTGTDKVTVIVGVRKLSDVGEGMVVELSPSYANVGTFGLKGHTGSSVSWHVKGSLTWNNTVALNQQAPKSLVLTSKADLSATDLTKKSSLTVNGITIASPTTDIGTGSFGKYPIYIGRRGGTSLPFNGHLYSLIGIGKLVSGNETVAIEKELAKHVGVTLNV